MAITAAVYRDTTDFPREELYGITSQMRRACVSVPTNIAEGFGRETTGAFIQFLRIAQGSLKELETLVELSSQLGFLATDKFESLNSDIVRLSKMLRALIRALKRRNGS
ncbi:MAG: four helix bundle protein [Parvularculaceae bacterium]